MSELRERSPLVEAEQAILGAILIDAQIVDEIHLRPEHFHESTHGRILEVCAALSRDSRTVDPVTVAHAMGSDPGLSSLGGLAYLADLVAQAPPAALAPDYAGVIRDGFTRRRLASIAGDAERAIRSGLPTEAAMQDLEQGLADLANDGPVKDAWRPAAHVVSEAIDRAKVSRGMSGLTTGLRDLDALTGGLRKGQMSILAARPGIGKSSAALNIARAAAQTGAGVCFFSMEMPESDLGLRLACDLAFDRYEPRSPHYFTAEKGHLDPDQWRMLDEAASAARRLPIAFDATPGLTVARMLSSVRRRSRSWRERGVDLGLVVVDHLLLARTDRERNGNKVAEIGDISRGLAEMAKALDVPVLALCQLSRAVEGRGTDKRPTLADLRWSGEIEADARQVMFLHRPEYYCRKPEDPTDAAGLVEYEAKIERVRRKLFWLVEKNSNGPTGEVETFFDVRASSVRDVPEGSR